MTTGRSLRATVAVAFTTGVLVMVAINNLAIFLKLNNAFYIPVIAFFVMGMVIQFFAMPNAKVISLLLIAYAAIFIGVAVDALLDFFFRSFERNMWGAEVVMWWVIALLPLLMGFTFVNECRKRKRKRQH